MRSLLDTLYAERRALFGCLVILIGTALIAASAMHLVEGPVQPAKFGTIAESMWWAIVTLGKIEPGSYLLVESLDRISRQEIMPSLTIFMDLVKEGINLVTLAVGRPSVVTTWPA